MLSGGRDLGCISLLGRALTVLLVFREPSDIRKLLALSIFIPNLSTDGDL